MYCSLAIDSGRHQPSTQALAQGSRAPARRRRRRTTLPVGTYRTPPQADHAARRTTRSTSRSTSPAPTQVLPPPGARPLRPSGHRAFGVSSCACPASLLSILTVQGSEWSRSAAHMAAGLPPWHTPQHPPCTLCYPVCSISLACGPLHSASCPPSSPAHRVYLVYIMCLCVQCACGATASTFHVPAFYPAGRHPLQPNITITFHCSVH